RRTLGKRVYGKPYRGFESHSLRHSGKGPFRTHGLRFIPETGVTLFSPACAIGARSENSTGRGKIPRVRPRAVPGPAIVQPFAPAPHPRGAGRKAKLKSRRLSGVAPPRAGRYLGPDWLYPAVFEHGPGESPSERTLPVRQREEIQALPRQLRLKRE